MSGTPATLFRFRSLLDDSGALFKRELGALADGYLYSPPFGSMNDPMEAYYETDKASADIIDGLLRHTGFRSNEIYKLIREETDKFALISFSSTHKAPPMWAYYASNFAGMCLEFDTELLRVGDLRGERLRPVTYARHPLPPLSLADIDKMQASVEARLSRKRIEWRHEEEWRYLTGEVGKKHYLDDALLRVFLGPRIKAEHEAKICQLLRRRPTEVLKGDVVGYELQFRTIQAACPLAECEKVGGGSFRVPDEAYRDEEITKLLSHRINDLVSLCDRHSIRPNSEEFLCFGVSAKPKPHLYMWTTYKLRSGRIHHHKHSFDHNLRELDLD
ncbi:MAG TPA: DUF2971 domain-containing protein [Devosia sp.]|nr:DUF2971 domain-containing protein [Devosia sp.]